MKRFFIIVNLFFCFISSQSQSSYSFAPVNDTIQGSSWENAMEQTFGLLPKAHYPTGYLLNKVSFPLKFHFANGQLNDSSFNMFEFYFLQNILRGSYYNPDSIIGYIKLDSIKNKYIENNNVLPWGLIDMTMNFIKDSAFLNNSIGVLNHRLVENTVNLNQIYSQKKIFCVSPLNLQVRLLNPQFILLPENVFTNNLTGILKIEVDLDDALGFQEIYLNQIFQTTYLSGGFKKFITRISYENGDTLYSRSELEVVDNSSLERLTSTYEPAGDCFTIGKPLTLAQVLVNDIGFAANNLIGKNYYQGVYANNFSSTYPTQFTPPMDEEKYAEACIWFGCGNNNKKIRKPFILFAGYNPKDGKSLQANSYAPWINNLAGPIISLDGWRGPMYETYNGYYTDASKNAQGGNSFGDNGNKFLDKIRQEGYDVIIVRIVDGIGYLQNNAYIDAEVLKYVNKKILSEVDGVTNPGSAIDPEAPGYPNTNVLKKAKHELIVGGLSAGALSTRMTLLLMEYENERDKCALTNRVHRTKTWVAIDCENQGSNTPIGFQMFLDFQKSLQYLPANVADIANSLLASTALGLLNHRGVATQNTLYSTDNMFYAGNSSWNVGHHSDFDDYFNDLTKITPSTYPANLKGYPKNVYRISISQGSANGINQILSNDVKLINNESPTSWCINPLGTMFGPGTIAGVGWYANICSYRKANARVLSSWNSNALTTKLGATIKTLIYSWHVNLGHWKYNNNNHIIDRYHSTYQTYDEAPASTLPTHMLLASKLPLSSRNLFWASITFCNSVDWNNHQHGFSPTVSGLDLHTPGLNTLPRYPELSLVPGNVSGGLSLMRQNNYTNPFDPSPHRDFGYPHLTFPTNHYDYTPFDAIWAHGDNISITHYDDNTMHVEDATPHIGEFLVEEIAPTTLYLSNRIIKGEQYTCNGSVVKEKYYADFEARNSVLAGDQSIYEHNFLQFNLPRYERQRTASGDFIINDGSVVTIRANNYNGTSSLTLGAGFSAKAGSIFRAYVFTDPNMCGPFGAQRMAASNATPPNTLAKESRPIISTKRGVTQNKNTNNKQTTAKIINLYPNPTSASVYVEMDDSRQTYFYIVKDIAGKELANGSLNQLNAKIDLSKLARGVYFITIESATILQTNRIILQW